MCTALEGMINATNSNCSHVRALTDELKADLVTVIAKHVTTTTNEVDTPLCVCGNALTATQMQAFSAIDKMCATAAGCYSIAHESGKLFLEEISSYTSHWVQY